MDILKKQFWMLLLSALPLVSVDEFRIEVGPCENPAMQIYLNSYPLISCVFFVPLTCL